MVVDCVDVHALRYDEKTVPCTKLVMVCGRTRGEGSLVHWAEWRSWASLSQVFGFAKQTRRFADGLTVLCKS
ncbi:hypothetical protein KC361_g224 [Hortaea werneckii]|nr:hypothetical protein KC361_g224 [Hortaea werneckii]